MKLLEEPLPGLKVLQPQVFEDDRGYFYESFNAEKMKDLGIDVPFVQDNQSLSQKGVVRGLHFQAPPHAQDKLVRVIKGAVLDVVLDIRKGSPTYGQTFAVELTEKNKLQFFVPKGFAHGFSTLEDNTIFFYKCSDFYNKASEGGVLYNDPSLRIDWKANSPTLSAKDTEHPLLKDFTTPFIYED
ncbi:MAG: dTDP-4-dehydrorhamnose 3,5-epimerase [Crocinitomicaceae bacterium]|nr:dTDP-4-dehydrorhamnose 3,5-epimerase [Crocinitomicaceae bacterium]|tara:strand:- start:3999 stop:4553 length:555 start_codon:yes stop_codon:yes gene_type:complete